MRNKNKEFLKLQQKIRKNEKIANALFNITQRQQHRDGYTSASASAYNNIINTIKL